MGTDACHISVIQHDDLICIQDGADSLCYDNRGNILCLFLQGLAKLAVSLEIKCGKAVVKDQDFRLLAIALAMERRCFWPPDTLFPPWEIGAL